MEWRSLVATAALLIAACHSPDDPVARGIATVTSTPDSAGADGAGVISIVASLDSYVPPGGRLPSAVTFRASGGTFVESGTREVRAPVYDNVWASATLRAPTEAQTVRVWAAAGTSTRTADILFTTAYPDAVAVLPSVLRVDSTSHAPVAIVVRLLREQGRVTTRLPVVFSAKRKGSDSQDTIGVYTTPVYSAGDSAVILYAPPADTATIEFTACVPRDENETDSNSRTLCGAAWLERVR